MRDALAATVLTVAARLVPAWRRPEWLESWQGELAWLQDGGASRATQRRFAAGAPLHALSERAQAWRPDGYVTDVRYAVRTLWRAPAFLLITVLTWTVGIGLNASLFSALNGLVLRAPDGIGDPSGLVQVGRHTEPERFDNWSWPFFERLQADLGPTFAGVAAYAAANASLGVGASVEPVAVRQVSDSYFSVLRVSMAAGRAWEAAPTDRAPEAVLSHALWRRLFGGDATVIGRTVLLDNVPLRVVGVAAEGFRGADIFREPADLFVPIRHRDVQRRPANVFTSWDHSWVWVVARLGPAATHEGARAAVRGLLTRLGRNHPELEGVGSQLVQGVGARPDARRETIMLAAIVLALGALVLGAAAANVGALALARAGARRGHTATRYALGASHGRVVRVVVLEHLLVGGVGGLIAVGLAMVVAPHLLQLLPVPVAASGRPDLRVVCFALALGMGAGLVCAVAPVLFDLRTDPRMLLQSAVGGGSRRGGISVRDGLVIAELALTCVVVAAASLLVSSAREVHRASPGFSPDGVLTVSIVSRRVDADASPLARALGAVRARPGTEWAALAERLPIVDPPRTRALRSREGEASPGSSPVAVLNAVSTDYFETIGLPLLRGRTFDATDEMLPQRSAIIDVRAAVLLFGSREAVGRVLPFEISPGVTPTVIGVVGAHRTRELSEQPVPAVYVALDPGRANAATLIARFEDPGPLVHEQAVRALQGALGPDAVVRRVGELRAQLTHTVRRTWLAARLVSLFGVLALILAGVGLYGTVSESVSRRRRELGIRMALGAAPVDLVRLVAARCARLVLMGLIVGAVLALAVSRGLSAVRFGADGSVVGPMMTAMGLMAVAAACATVVPLRRALRTSSAALARE